MANKKTEKINRITPVDPTENINELKFHSKHCFKDHTYNGAE